MVVMLSGGNWSQLNDGLSRQFHVVSNRCLRLAKNSNQMRLPGLYSWTYS